MWRFSMRELMLLVSLAGVGIAWGVERRGHENSQRALAVTRAHAERLRKSLELADGENKGLVDTIKNGPRPWVTCGLGLPPPPEWELAKQPIP